MARKAHQIEQYAGIPAVDPLVRAPEVREEPAGNADFAAARQVAEQLARSFEEYKKANDAHLAEIKKGSDDVVRREQVAKIDATVADLQKALQSLEVKMNRPAFGGADPAVDEAKAKAADYRKAFDRFFIKGDPALLHKALQTDSDPDGGFMVPTEIESTITRVVATISAMRRLSQVVTTGAQTYKKPVNLGGAGAGWVGEREARPETATPKLSMIDVLSGEIYANPAATQTMLDDANMNVEQWLSTEVAQAFADQEGAAFISGDGVNKPKGFLTYPIVNNASYAWGSVGRIRTGASGAFAASGPADTLIDVIHALRPGYRPGAAWLMSDLTLSAIRKFKDTTGQYLWQPSLQAGQPATLLGYACEIDENMPTIAANSYSLAFANWSRAYLIADRTGVRVLRDPYTAKPYVMFYTTKRVGGAVQNFEAIKLLQFAT